MKKKGFTLIELLVVIAIIAMLLAILMPALNKVKRLAQRLVCATNLKGMGTALMVYSNDDKYEQYPVQGGKADHVWAEVTHGWHDPDYVFSDNEGSLITTGASLFLLVREADVDTKSFVCKSSDQRAYEGELHTGAADPGAELVELWDFGNAEVLPGTGPKNCVSYAYQLPYQGNDAFSARPANSSGSASMALMADRNPWFDDDLVQLSATPVDADEALTAVYLIDWLDGAPKYKVQVGHSNAHNREGQNVLFNDGHAEFTQRSDVGVQNDNIYTVNRGANSWDEDDIRIGSPTGTFTQTPKNSKDTWLVNDCLRI